MPSSSHVSRSLCALTGRPLGRLLKERSAPTSQRARRAQERRFQKRMKDPTRSWKLSAMDVESRSRSGEYSRAKDEMFAHTDIEHAHWYVVRADVKKAARLSCTSHLLSTIEYEVGPSRVEGCRLERVGSPMRGSSMVLKCRLISERYSCRAESRMP